MANIIKVTATTIKNDRRCKTSINFTEPEAAKQLRDEIYKSVPHFLEKFPKNSSVRKFSEAIERPHSLTVEFDKAIIFGQQEK